MARPTQIPIPSLVRMKPGALDRLGHYCRRLELGRVALLVSEGFVETLADRVVEILRAEGVATESCLVVHDASFEQAQSVFAALPSSVDGLIGLGGGKAMDVAKYVAFLARRPYVAVPTSLSNDGFCSPQSSLTLEGKRRSLPAALPSGVVVDTLACLEAPLPLWCSGVGDLVAKLTAVRDWKLAFAADGTPVDDFAALLSDATVYQFLAAPRRDQEGVKMLATALMLNGIAMEICGSSRPASGSEHLISHALDATSARPRLHGLQVGIATYLVAHAQFRTRPAQLPSLPTDPAKVAGLLETTGVFDAVRVDPFSRKEWTRAIRLAPSLKNGFYTVLSARDWTDDLVQLTEEDPVLAGCFVD